MIRELTRLAPPGLAMPVAFWSELAAAYAPPPHRAYHSLEHVVAVARHHANVARDVGWQQPNETYLAVLFHDAVYVPGAADNELRSAVMARAAIASHLGARGMDSDRVAWLIELTARHGSLTAADVDIDAALFLDCDMAILGADPETFDAYDRAVRAEYAHVPDDLYRAGRAAFLEKLLASPAIFVSPYFAERLEARARANLSRSVLALR